MCDQIWGDKCVDKNHRTQNKFQIRVDYLLMILKLKCEKQIKMNDFWRWLICGNPIRNPDI